MRKAVLLFAMLTSFCWGTYGSALAEEAGSDDRPKVEFSLRSWLFTTGETKWSHNASGFDSRLGNPTSQLTYKDNDTHIIELTGRVNFARRWYAQGDFGFSVKFNHGTMTDDDFSSVGGQHLWSRTESDTSGSGTQYVNLNVGYRAKEFKDDRGYLDVFGGVQYWRTRNEATGVRQIVCTSSGIPGVTCPPAGSNLVGVLALTNTAHWITPIQIGVDTEYRIFRPLGVTFKGAISPASVVYNEDVHHLRSDLQQDPSFSMWGVGVGVNAEAGIKVVLSRHFALTGGYRVWWNRTYAGTWENHPVSGSSDQVPLTEFQTLRHGALVGLTGIF